jgi:EAL domain-containing protein (putative c-di-GMP-specific phosphodiesterase class I)
MVALLERVLERFPVVIELTERALSAQPTELMGLVDRLRARGAQIAVEAIGVDPRSLALLPFLRPDVIKLVQLMQDSPSREIAEVIHAVNAESERTGAIVLAEGIETEKHLRRALALAATYGQGCWLFAPLPGSCRPTPQLLVRRVCAQGPPIWRARGRRP